MIVAYSKDINCINRLTNLLEKTYPGLTFNIFSNYTNRIEIPDNLIKEMQELNPDIFTNMIIFCDGYTIGWGNAND